MSPSTKTPDADRGQSHSSQNEPPSQAFADVFQLLGQLRAFIGYYVSTRIDQLRLTVRSLVIWLALAVVGLIALAAVVVTAVVQVLGGIAGGVGQIVPDHAWIGSLATGLVVLAVVFFGVRRAVGFIGRMSRAAMIAKYEAYKSEQRQQFGRSVSDRAD